MAVRREINFIFAVILLSCISIVFSILSLSTKNWFSRTAASYDFNYGLFSGTKIRNNQELELNIVCKDGYCMYSCGLDSSKRQSDISRLLEGGDLNDPNICFDYELDNKISPKNYKNAETLAELDKKKLFLNFGLWLGTIIFISISIIFSFTSGSMALYNIVRSPFQPILSILGLYIWNTVSAISSILAMSLWAVAYAQSLKKSGAISNTITLEDDRYTNNGSLGYSYWFLTLPILLSFGNIILLKFRTILIARSEKKIIQVIDDKITNGETLLF